MNTTTTTRAPTPDAAKARITQRLEIEGYALTHFPESWEDVGDAENGPLIQGGPAYDEWRNGNHVVIVIDGEIVDQFVEQPFPDNFPF